MKKGLKAILAGAAGAFPFVAFAQNITNILLQIQGIINVLIPFIIGLAVLVIIWGILGYISGAGDEEKRGEAKQYIIWGIIGVFIMLSVWGLVNVLVSSFNLNTAMPTQIPTVGGIYGTACTIVASNGTRTSGTYQWVDAANPSAGVVCK